MFTFFALTQIDLHVPEGWPEVGVEVVVEQRLDLQVDVRLQQGAFG